MFPPTSDFPQRLRRIRNELHAHYDECAKADFDHDLRNLQALLDVMRQIEARAERDEIASVNFSPDGRLLVGSDGKETYVWEIASGQLKQKLSKATQATFSPDGRTLATVYGDQLTLWDVYCH